MTQIFADAFYFIALINPHDQHHAAAVRASSQLNRSLITTHWVLVEVADALGLPGIRVHTAAFLRRIATDPNVTVLPPDSGLFERGLELYARRPDKAWSLTDCIPSRP